MDHQLAWAHQHNLMRWELFHVYDDSGQLDRRRCFWLVYSLADVDEPPHMRTVAWGELPEIPFEEFTRWHTPLETVEGWIAAARARRHEHAYQGP